MERTNFATLLRAARLAPGQDEERALRLSCERALAELAASALGDVPRLAPHGAQDAMPVAAPGAASAAADPPPAPTPLRPDVPVPPLLQDEALQNAAIVDRGCFVVPRDPR